ncbi:MAG: hypothetical protein F6K42_08015 [Leptolyngbya sp. SIO1D8]|nr:hypothetical protein [Leptolyngbya sp. SIO1D8]
MKSGQSKAIENQPNSPDLFQALETLALEILVGGSESGVAKSRPIFIKVQPKVIT